MTAAAAAYERGDAPAAIATYRALAVRRGIPGPDRAVSLVNLATLLGRQGDQAGALTALDQAVVLDGPTGSFAAAQRRAWLAEHRPHPDPAGASRWPAPAAPSWALPLLLAVVLVPLALGVAVDAATGSATARTWWWSGGLAVVWCLIGAGLQWLDRRQWIAFDGETMTVQGAVGGPRSVDLASEAVGIGRRQQRFGTNYRITATRAGRVVRVRLPAWVTGQPGPLAALLRRLAAQPEVTADPATAALLARLRG